MQGIREDNNWKRKREEKFSFVEEIEVRDIIMVLFFEKKLSIWKIVELMEVFKIFLQSFYFILLLEIREDVCEMFVVGMLLIFFGLFEEVKFLKFNNFISLLNSFSDFFIELEKYGFDVKVFMLWISKLLFFIDR